MGETVMFHWADYVVFATSLLVCPAIGIYHGCLRNKQQTTDEFFLGGKKLGVVPVALSLQASFLSAIAVLGWPAEMYFNGYMAFLMIIGINIGLALSAHIFVPVFRRISMASAYEYIGIRFNKVVRVLSSCTFFVMMLLYMAVVLYAPALAFSQVSGLSMWITILGVGLVCSFYTTIGGMKAVVWTDAFQMAVLVTGVLTLLIKGSLDAGGIATVWENGRNGSRLGTINIDFHPHARHTIWTESVGATFLTISVMGCNQASIQRYMAMSSLKEAQRAIYLTMFNSTLVTSMFAALGLVMYSYYSKCDPYLEGRVSKPDQMVLVLMMDVLGDLHGLPGLFTSAVFSGALSSISSGMNSMSAVIVEDLAKPAYIRMRKYKMTETFATVLAKILAMSLGLATIGLAYLFSGVANEVLEVAFSIFGMVGGPMLGLFSLALFFPLANSWGAGVGLVTGLLVCFWVGVGAILNPYRYTPLLHLTKSDCALYTDHNERTPILTTSSIPTLGTASPSVISLSGGGIQELYRVSYMWYTLIGTVVTVVVGLLVSAITGGNKEPVDTELMFKWRPSCCSTRHCNNSSYDVSPFPETGELNENKNYSISSDQNQTPRHKDGSIEKPHKVENEMAM